MTKIIKIKERGCGRRGENKLYLTAGTNQSKDGILPIFTLLNPPIPYPVPLHRGARIVNDKALLERKPMNKWWADSSKETEIRKLGNEWYIERFGMSLSKRLKFGECTGCKTVEDALAKLVGKIKFDHLLIDEVRILTHAKVQDNRYMLPHYDSLLKNLYEYVDHKKFGSLISIQASIWKLEHATPPAKRAEVLITLSKMLSLMNLRKDALVMYLRSIE